MDSTGLILNTLADGTIAHQLQSKLASEKVNAEVIDTSGMKISHCIGCNYCFLKTPGVHFLYPLCHLKQPGPAGNAPGFQRGGNCEADGLFGASGVRNNETRGHGVKSPLHALHACIERLEVYAQILSLFGSHGASNIELAF